MATVINDAKMEAEVAAAKARARQARLRIINGLHPPLRAVFEAVVHAKSACRDRDLDRLDRAVRVLSMRANDFLDGLIEEEAGR